MKKCLSCGYENNKTDMRCPECGAFYSKVIEIITQEEADEALQTFRGQCQRILKSGQIKHELRTEWQRFKAGLTPKAKLSLWVIFVFVFALIVSIL
jgi:predicted ATP-dependent serine protease